MKMKKQLCAVLALCLFLSGCDIKGYFTLKGVNTDVPLSAEESTATPASTERPDGCEGAALDFLEALRDGRHSEIRLFADDVPGYTGTETHALFSAAYASLSWKLQGYKESGSGYALTLELTVRDMREVLTQLSEAVGERQSAGCDRAALAEEILRDILAETDYPTLTRRVTMNLSKATGTWALRGSDELYNALSGYLLQSLKEFDLPVAVLAESAMDEADNTTAQKIYGDWQCTFTVLGVYPNAPEGYTLTVQCDNKASGERVFAAQSMLVNGYVIDPEWYVSVGANQSYTGSIVLSRGELARCGITNVKNISFRLEVFTTHAWPVYPELSADCTVYPHGRDKGASALVEREGQQRLMDCWCAGFTVLDILDEGCWGCELLVAIDNRSREELWFGVGELSVDGRSFDPGWSQLLSPGAKAVETIRIPAGELLANGADGATVLDFRVFVSDLVNLDKKDEGISENGRYTVRIRD